MKQSILAVCATTLALAPLASAAEDSALRWLFVQTASGFTVDGSTLTVPYEREIFSFTDRPDRLHDYLSANEFSHLWKLSEVGFSEDPPNAVLTWFEGDEVHEAELVLVNAEVGSFGREIAYTFTHLTGDEMPETAQHASLFVDDVINIGSITTRPGDVMCFGCAGSDSGLQLNGQDVSPEELKRLRGTGN